MSPWGAAFSYAGRAALPVMLLWGPLFIFGSVAVGLAFAGAIYAYGGGLLLNDFFGGISVTVAFTLVGWAVGAIGCLLIGIPIGAILIRFGYTRLRDAVAAGIGILLAVFAGTLLADFAALEGPAGGLSWANVAKRAAGLGVYGYFVLGYAALCWIEWSRHVAPRARGEQAAQRHSM